MQPSAAPAEPASPTIVPAAAETAPPAAAAEAVAATESGQPPASDPAAVRAARQARLRAALTGFGKSETGTMYFDRHRPLESGDLPVDFFRDLVDEARDVYRDVKGDFTAWSSSLVNNFGESVKAQLQPIWDHLSRTEPPQAGAARGPGAGTMPPEPAPSAGPVLPPGSAAYWT